VTGKKVPDLKRPLLQYGKLKFLSWEQQQVLNKVTVLTEGAGDQNCGVYR
jgi:hypothetical protein